MELAEATARGVADDVDSWVGAGTVDDAIGVFIDGLVRRMETASPRLAALVMRRVSAANVTPRPLPGDPILFDDILTDIVREAQHRGEIRPGLHPREVGEVLAGMTLDALGRWAAEETARVRCESGSSSGSTPSSAPSAPRRPPPIGVGEPPLRRVGAGCSPCRAEYSDDNITIMVTERTEESPTGIDTLSRRRRVGILLICSMSLLIVGLDVTIVNVALPSIGRDFHAPLSGLQWTVDAYTLVLASLLMLSGSTADRLGRRRTFVIGLLDLRRRLPAVQPGPEPDDAGRVPHGPGRRRVDAEPGGHVDHHQHLHRSPGSGPRPSGSGRAVVGVSMALGPVVGGLLVDLGRAGGPSSGSTSRSAWPPSCWPCATSPSPRRPQPRRVDAVGQVLVIVAPGLAHLRHHRGARAGAGRRRSSSAAFAVAWSSLVGAACSGSARAASR